MLFQQIAGITSVPIVAIVLSILLRNLALLFLDKKAIILVGGITAALSLLSFYISVGLHIALVHKRVQYSQFLVMMNVLFTVYFLFVFWWKSWLSLML